MQCKQQEGKRPIKSGLFRSRLPPLTFVPSRHPEPVRIIIPIPLWDVDMLWTNWSHVICCFSSQFFVLSRHPAATVRIPMPLRHNGSWPGRWHDRTCRHRFQYFPVSHLATKDSTTRSWNWVGKIAYFELENGARSELHTRSHDSPVLPPARDKPMLIPQLCHFVRKT